MFVRLLGNLLGNRMNIPLRRFAFEGGIPDVAALPDLIFKIVAAGFRLRLRP